jgi:thymidine phosphorylase
MTRDWEKFTNDEISCIWKGYVQTEFKNYDVLNLSIAPSIKEMRLTPMEIVRLVDELMNRLEIKSEI